MRCSCANNLVLGCTQYNKPDSCSYLCLVLEFVEPLEAWHSDQNRRLRCVDESVSWMAHQLLGGFMGCLFSILKTVRQEKSLEVIPMTLPRPGRFAAAGMDECMAIGRDKMATVMADGALVLGGLRLQRCLWMLRRWPNRLVPLLSEAGGLGELFVKALREDYQNFLAFQANLDGFPGVQEICERSVFRLQTVLQDLRILRKNDWAMTAEALEHVGNSNRRCLASQASVRGCLQQARECKQGSESEGHRRESLWSPGSVRTPCW